jgi:hypothetical protein
MPYPIKKWYTKACETPWQPNQKRWPCENTLSMKHWAYNFYQGHGIPDSSDKWVWLKSGIQMFSSYSALISGSTYICCAHILLDYIMVITCPVSFVQRCWYWNTRERFLW